MIDESIGEKAAITRGISNIIYNIYCFKREWSYRLSPQQKEELDEVSNLLKKILSNALE
jgi:hypothetical protein